ncbi:hypothetical protein [Cellulomonas uda]|uniref:Luciferase-like domain-containing protein n=1 Tax=Cellulomonas uda TaxID=1714 RepID=A0A4Y3K7R8_CELUD|nr:hypothetical protein [Cellulomonas uda]NII67742.1 alkanesulfonate monooxygenase SsuD/methylene tetrahydromethanopterin reductase-like flavin-dependent oxidoreductase (luciferase family) [Cellulomonas uda]GEA80012.1 hypothetical protein CUD01_04560 [Cellulomonas uda]
MAQPLAHVRTPDLTSPARPAAVALAAATPRHVTEFVIDDSTLVPTTLALAAARADVIRVRHGAGLPTHAAVRALVAMLDGEMAALGRPRSDVTVVLEVETVVADDARDAARRRGHLAYAAAFSHLAWHVDATMLVAPLDALAAEAAQVARRAGVDRVELALVGGSRRHAAALARTLT